MILSQTIACVSGFGDERAIELMAQAGYDASDYSMSSMSRGNSVLNSDGYREYALKLCEIAKRNGVYFNQGHAPYSVSCDDKETAEKLLWEYTVRAIEIAGIMGIETLIVHPVDSGDYIGRESYVREKNIKYYRSLIPYAEKYGVKLGCENMWSYDKRRKVIVGSVCSNPYEHAAYIDELNSEMVVACLDVGHSALAGREAQDCIRVLGDRIGALHIHDNDYRDDMHTLPGLSEMNWDEIMKALAEIGYKGDFTFETDHFFDSLCTEEEALTGLRLSVLIGRRLIKKLEDYSK